MKKVALALSSGGPRGFAYIGAIEELLSRGYENSSVAGASAGSLIGGIYAAGGLDAFKEWLYGLDPVKIIALMDFSISKNHLVKGDRIIKVIKERVPEVNIEDLPIPYCAVATDLKAGKEVLFNKGSLFQAIRASISLPSFYEPVQRDDMILIDGGVINPLPLNRVKRQAGDILVGIDVSGHDYKAQWDEQQRLTAIQKSDASLKTKILDMLIPDNIDFNYYTVLSRASSLMIRQNSILMAQLMNPDILIDIQMNRYGTFDFDKSEKLIAIGRQKTLPAIDKYENSQTTGKKSFFHKFI